MIQSNLKQLMFERDKLEDITNVLHDGGTILYPTDTIWGIGCDATNADAVHKIFALKKREITKPFVLLVDSLDMLQNYVVHLHPRIETLLLYHTKPLTVIYEEGKNLPDISVAADRSVAVRVVLDSFCKELIGKFGKPLIATSANVSDQPFPANFGGISSDILCGVDYVVKWKQGEKKQNEPSVIVRLSDKEDLIFIRE